MNTVATKLDSYTSTVTESIKTITEESPKRTVNNAEIRAAKRTLSDLWTNTINTRKQAYWQYYRAQKTSEVFEDLLQQDPPKMQRKFLPKQIENEPDEELEMRRQLSIEKFRAEINLLKVRAEKYEEKLKKIDENRASKIESTFKEETAMSLTHLWTQECQQQEDISATVFTAKKNWFLENTSSEYRSDVRNRNKDSYKNKKRDPFRKQKSRKSQARTYRKRRNR